MQKQVKKYLESRASLALGYKMKQVKGNRVLPREHINHSNTLSNNTREDFARGHHQMVNIKIRLIIFFAAEGGEALYSQQK